MGKMKISQEAFDELVRENIEELGMDPEESLEDAIHTLTLQSVDLSGIITTPSTTNPILLSLTTFKSFLSTPADVIDLKASLDEFTHLCSSPDSPNPAIASRNDGLQLLTSICSRLSLLPPHSSESDIPSSLTVIISALTALSSLLRDVPSNETFQRCGGPDIIIKIIKNTHPHDPDLLNAAFAVVAAASTGTEVLKESFVNLKIEEYIVKAFKCGSCIPSLYDAIRVLLSSDDPRVAASQVFGYARRFAKLGIADSLVDALQKGITSPTLIPATVALKTLVVNDDICRSVADKGGIDAVLRCIDDSGEQYNKTVARTCCSLLSKLAGSDMNKSAIVERQGMDRLMTLCARFADDPSVIQEVLYIFSILSLRSPEHASRAMEAGAGDLVIQVMQKFPASQLLQRNACFMIRNLVARNPENRKILLDNGIEKIIRKAKESHECCKDAATDALRDLGLANYNL